MVTMKTPESVPVEQVGITAEDVQQQSTANQTSAAEQNDEAIEQVDFSDEEADRKSTRLNSSH